MNHVQHELPSRITLAGLYILSATLPISHVGPEFGILIAIIGWLAEGILNRNWQTKWHPIFPPLIFYLSWNLVSAIISINPAHSLFKLANNQWPVLTFLMMYWTIRDVQTFKSIVTTFLISSSFIILYALWQTFSGVELYRHVPLDIEGSSYRIVGLYGFYLSFAAYAMIVFFLALVRSLTGFSKTRWYFGILAALSFLAVLNTFARSIWLGLAAAFPVFFFKQGKRTTRIVLTGAAIAVMIITLSFSGIRDRASSIFSISKNETRINLWKTAIDIAKDHPVFGIGSDNWRFYVDTYKVPGFYDTTVHPHSDHLNIIMSSGLPGYVAFMYIWFLLIRNAFRNYALLEDQELKAILMGGTLSVIGLLVGGFFQLYYGTFVNCWDWWFVAGLVLTIDKYVVHQRIQS